MDPQTQQNMERQRAARLAYEASRPQSAPKPPRHRAAVVSQTESNRQRVLDYLEVVKGDHTLFSDGLDGLTADDMEAQRELDDADGLPKTNCVRQACSELHREGLIEAIGERETRLGAAAREAGRRVARPATVYRYVRRI